MSNTLTLRLVNAIKAFDELVYEMDTNTADFEQIWDLLCEVMEVLKVEIPEAGEFRAELEVLETRASDLLFAVRELKGRLKI